jgi:hypothetical protein
MQLILRVKVTATKRLTRVSRKLCLSMRQSAATTLKALAIQTTNVEFEALIVRLRQLRGKTPDVLLVQSSSHKVTLFTNPYNYQSRISTSQTEGLRE